MAIASRLLAVEPDVVHRPPALDPHRCFHVLKGGTTVWAGALDLSLHGERLDQLGGRDGRLPVASMRANNFGVGTGTTLLPRAQVMTEGDSSAVLDIFSVAEGAVNWKVI